MDGTLFIAGFVGIIALVLLYVLFKKGKRARELDIESGNPKDARSWEIGPWIDGRTKSLNVPRHPNTTPYGLSIDIPYPTAEAGHVHYVTFDPGTLKGKRGLRLRYRVEMGEGVGIHPPSSPTGDSMITLFLQRSGDTFSGKDKYETYRWWATSKTQQPIIPGEHELIAYFDTDIWTAVEKSNSVAERASFIDAINNVERVGFTLGGGDGYGHGVFATGPARLTIVEYSLI